MSRRITLAVVLSALALALVPAVPVGPAAASGTVLAPPFDAARAVAFLEANQQPDGGFETAGFPGFETPDAVLAIAEAAQTGPSWSSAQARAAVAATVKDGRTPLDYLDDLAETTPSAGQAAKLVVLAVAPLGFDPAAFDPQGDGAANLVARMDSGANADGSFGPPGALNATLYAVLASRLAGRAVPAATRAFVLAAQQANGGWNFAGDPKGSDVDVDTTGLALQALAAAGVDPFDEPVRRAVAFLAANRLPTGGWAAFGAEDPNATALAILGLTAAGRDVATCWPAAAASLAARQAPDGHVAGPNDSFGVNTFATSQAVQALTRRWLPVVRAPAYCADDGYRLVAADGGVFAFGSPFLGSAGGLRLNRPVVGMASRPGGQGYWLVADDGGVFAFGDAPFLGSTGALRLNRPVVAMAATPSGRGYWLVASDGGVFAFGDAPYLGSTGALALNRPVVGMAATPSGRGYRLVADDGGVFAFGDAAFAGSAASLPLAAPVTAMASAASGPGYWLVGRDGGVFAFGGARYHGRSAVSHPSPSTGTVAILPTLAGDGYLLVSADGGVAPSGADRRRAGGLPRLAAPVVGVSP
ncbi:MAG TPA: prenyltransferase/squalene oxidase repeat-containing protein [Acidimicrobiales bacterium]|jgi:hypothetical protein|nr:prenyltransferase/squalene oxidase repeat-containing protein [Acidimicrobiales bacterium]